MHASIRPSSTTSTKALWLSPSARTNSIELVLSVLISLCCHALHYYHHRGHYTSDEAYNFHVSLALSLFSVPVHFLSPFPNPRSFFLLRPCDDVIGLAVGVPLLLASSITLYPSQLLHAAAIYTLFYCIFTNTTSHSNFPSLISLFGAVITTILVFPRDVHCAFVSVLTHILIHACHRSFTVAEATVIAVTLVSALSRPFHHHHFNNHNDDGIDTVIALGLSGCALLWLTCVMPFTYLTTSSSSSTSSTSSTSSFHTSKIPSYIVPFCLFIVILITYFTVFLFISHEPIHFVFLNLLLKSSPTSFFLLFFWSILVFLAISVIRPETSILERAIARKYYHCLALFIFLVPSSHLQLLRLSAVVALGLLLLIEALRVAGPVSIRVRICSMAQQLVDERDSGPVVLTHIYLLLGCAVPVWLTSFGHIGVVAVCVQDAVAAAVGKQYGVHAFGRRKRTVEGAVGGAIAAVLMLSVITHVLGLGSGSDVGRVEMTGWIVGAFATAFVEAFTDQVDNWVVPLTFCTVYAAVVN